MSPCCRGAMMSAMTSEVLVAIEPTGDQIAARSAPSVIRSRREHLTKSIEASGAKIVPAAQANSLVWLATYDPISLGQILDENPQITWVQLPWAGVEHFVESGLLQRPVTFTCAKGAFAEQVSEHALFLILALLRHATVQARKLEWHEVEPISLAQKRVTILGAGGIATLLIPFLQAANCEITVVRRSEQPVDGANKTVAVNRLHEVLPDTEILVIALALTPETRGIIGKTELSLLPQGALVVNVARGGHIDTQALVSSLESGHIGGAGLDVTDPEPLPSDHPLWKMENVLITSHCADSAAHVTQKLTERTVDNVNRIKEGLPMVGVVEPSSGY